MAWIHTKDTVSNAIFSSTTSSSSHLKVLTGLNCIELITIVLLELGEDNTSSWQVETDGESGGGKHNLQVSITEENLDELS